MSESASFRCGYVAIVGRPNVGKSTLLNALIGAKVSIVSRKAQTTRHRIHGILTTPSAQFVFVDTPGFQTRHGGALNRVMNRVVQEALAGVDVVVMVVEAGKWGEGEKVLLPALPTDKRVVLAINKIDQVKDKSSLFAWTGEVAAQHPFAAIVPVSAERGTQLPALLAEVEPGLPQGEAHYESDAMTDRSERFMAAEIVREKLFRLVGDELPYDSTVIIEKWEEEGSLRRIYAAVVVARDAHKAMVIGKQGSKLKRIGSEARQDMEKLFGGKVHLELWVKTRGGWADSEASLREFGYE
jgi:GTP-binding protein Era